MEQKQLDEINDSYFGDEFIEEELNPVVEEVKIEKVKVEMVKAKKDLKKEKKLVEAKETKKAIPTKNKSIPILQKAKKRELPKTNFKTNPNTKFIKASSIAPSIKKEASKKEAPKESSSKEIASETHGKKDNVSNVSKKSTGKITSPEEVLIFKSTAKPLLSVGTAEGTNNANESLPKEHLSKENVDGDSGFLKSGLWQIIAGIAVILLIASILTQGFQISGVSGESLSLPEAEKQALDYVNSNLLQPPFTATIEQSEKKGDIYLITLNVAGQSIDSYITRDGKLFFPQGLVMDPQQDLVDEENQVPEDLVNEFIVIDETEVTGPIKEITEPVTEPVKVEPVKEVTPEVLENTEESLIEESPVTDNPSAAGDVTEVSIETEVPAEVSPEVPVSGPSNAELTLQAKRWLFNPAKLTVVKGSHVLLTVNPENLQFKFAIPSLGIEKQINGPTLIEFDVPNSGTYAYSCSSCDEWRGMAGTLKVE